MALTAPAEVIADRAAAMMAVADSSLKLLAPSAGTDVVARMPRRQANARGGTAQASLTIADTSARFTALSSSLACHAWGMADHRAGRFGLDALAGGRIGFTHVTRRDRRSGSPAVATRRARVEEGVVPLIRHDVQGVRWERLELSTSRVWMRRHRTLGRPDRMTSWSADIAVCAVFDRISPLAQKSHLLVGANVDVTDYVVATFGVEAVTRLGIASRNSVVLDIGGGEGFQVPLTTGVGCLR